MRLELIFRHRSGLAGAIGQRLADSLIGKTEAVSRVFRRPESLALAFFAGSELARLALVAHELAKAPLGALANLGRVGNEFGVFGLPGIVLHRRGLVSDVFYLIDAVRFGECPPRHVVARQSRGWNRRLGGGSVAAILELASFG